EQVDDLAHGGGDLDGALGAVEVLYGTAEKDEAVGGGGADLLAGKLKVQLAAQLRHLVQRSVAAFMNGDVEELAFAALLPDNEAGDAGGFAVDNDFVGADGVGFGDVA